MCAGYSIHQKIFYNARRATRRSRYSTWPIGHRAIVGNRDHDVDAGTILTSNPQHNRLHSVFHNRIASVLKTFDLLRGQVAQVAPRAGLAHISGQSGLTEIFNRLFVLFPVELLKY